MKTARRRFCSDSYLTVRFGRVQVERDAYFGGAAVGRNQMLRGRILNVVNAPAHQVAFENVEPHQALAEVERLLDDLG